MKSIVACQSPFYSYRSIFDVISNFEPFLSTSLAYENFEELSDLYCMEYVIPGYNKRDISVKVEQNILRVEGQNSNKGIHFFKKKINPQELYFVKELYLHEGMDIERISAKYKNGILRIEIPKKSVEKQYRKIPVFGEETEGRIINENKVSAWLNLKRKIKDVFNK